MGNLFKYIVALLRSRAVSGANRGDVGLEKLRLSHPTCTIMSQHLHDTYLGEHVAILQGASLNKVSLRSCSYVGCNSSLTNVEVGSFCSIGPHVRIGLARHPSRTFISTYPAFYSNQNTGCPLSFRKDKIFDDSVPKTSIGHDVWIGEKVLIPGGVRIGIGAILAAGSVVVKDVPSYAVVGGNPAQLIRFRFSDEHIKVLLASEWWTWPIEKISNNVEWFSDIEKFKTMVEATRKS